MWKARTLSVTMDLSTAKLLVLNQQMLVLSQLRRAVEFCLSPERARVGVPFFPPIALVRCNIVVTTNFLFLGKSSFKFWKRLSNHRVLTKFSLNNSKQTVRLQNICEENLYPQYQREANPFFTFLEVHQYCAKAAISFQLCSIWIQ